jgi:hypothetical protein
MHESDDNRPEDSDLENDHHYESIEKVLLIKKEIEQIMDKPKGFAKN